MSATEAAPAGTRGASGLVERYEELREQVLRGATAGCRLGLALLLREGLAGWMEAWGRCPEGPYPTTPPAPSASSHEGLQGELVRVLAAMALGGLERARA